MRRFLDALRDLHAAVISGMTPRIGESEGWLLKSKKKNSRYGAIAQLGERIVRNDEVVGSSPTSSTNLQQLSAADFAITFQNVPIQFAIAASFAIRSSTISVIRATARC